MIHKEVDLDGSGVPRHSSSLRSPAAARPVLLPRLEDKLWFHTFDFVTSVDLLWLAQASAGYVSALAKIYLFNTPEVSLGEEGAGAPSSPSELGTPPPSAPRSIEYHGDEFVTLPLSYAGLRKSGDQVVWDDSLITQQTDADSLKHFTLDADACRLPKILRKLLLFRCTRLATLEVRTSFFQCKCEECAQTAAPVLPGRAPLTPKVVFENQFRDMRPNSSDEEVEEPEQPALSTRVRHISQRLSLVLMIILRNYRTLTAITIDGPAFSTHRISNKLIVPFPMPPNDSNQTRCFPLLETAVFGCTVDCRYIVSFLDHCLFAKLRSVRIGRLELKYERSHPLFGLLPLVVFAPQYIAKQTTCQSAPHLPAIYNGVVDGSLRFQGLGAFCCDEYHFEGEFRDGVNHGFGFMRSISGEQYMGEWRNGQRCGRGIVRQATGDTMGGDWIEDGVTGIGWAETRVGFQYHGQWQNSNFEGWGMLQYKDCLLGYGQLSCGYYGKWCRCVKATRDENNDLLLVWEEQEHDQYGAIQKCFQVSLNIPATWQEMLDQASLVTGMSCSSCPRKLKKELTKILQDARNQFQSPTFNMNESKDYLRGMRHGFPDEDSPYRSTVPRTVTMSRSTRANTGATNMSAIRRLGRTISVHTPGAHAHTRQASSEVMSSPTKQTSVKSLMTSCFNDSTPRAAFNSGNLFAPLETPSPPGSVGAIPAFSSSPCPLNALSPTALSASPTAVGATGVSPAVLSSSPMTLNATALATALSPSPPARASVPRASPVASPLLAPPAQGSPLLAASPTPSLSEQVRLMSRSETQTSSLECVDGEETVDEQHVTEESTRPDVGNHLIDASSRSSSALMQAIETYKDVLAHVNGDREKCDLIFLVFSLFTKTLFRRLHTDWLRATTPEVKDKLLQQSRLKSPLPVPDISDVPDWFREDMLIHFGLKDGLTRLQQDQQQIAELVDTKMRLWASPPAP